MKESPFQAGSRWCGAAARAGVAFVMLLGVVVPTAVEAQETDTKRNRTRVVLRISEALDLDEDQTLRFASQYRKVDKRRHELIAERAVTEVELETAVGRDPQDEAQVRKLTDQLLAIDKELILLPDALFESVQDMLDTNQRARLALLKIKLQRKIDRERSRRQGGAKKNAKKQAPTS